MTITVKIHAADGIHDPAWKDFVVTDISRNSTIDDVKNHLSKYFCSGYHTYGVKFMFDGKTLTPNTLVNTLISSNDNVLYLTAKMPEKGHIPERGADQTTVIQPDKSKIMSNVWTAIFATIVAGLWCYIGYQIYNTDDWSFKIQVIMLSILLLIIWYCCGGL